MTITRFRTGGMTCPACPRLLDERLERLSGVVSAESNLETGWTTVVYDPALLDPGALAKIIRESGFDPAVDR